MTRMGGLATTKSRTQEVSSAYPELVEIECEGQEPHDDASRHEVKAGGVGEVEHIKRLLN